MPARQRPATLSGLWFLLLLAPTAWASSLGLLFSLTNDACVSGSRASMFTVAAVCVMLAWAPALPAWWWRQRVVEGSASAERTRLMLGMAVGGSVLFGLVNLLTSIPLFMLDTCRT